MLITPCSGLMGTLVVNGGGIKTTRCAGYYTGKKFGGEGGRETVDEELNQWAAGVYIASQDKVIRFRCRTEVSSVGKQAHDGRFILMLSLLTLLYKDIKL